MKRVFFFYLIAWIVAVAEVCSGQTVVNGSFETGTTPPFGGAYVPAPNSSTISGWTIQSGSVDYIGDDTWPAAAGNRSLDLSGHNAGAIAQTISGFTPGHQYRLSFYMAGNNDGVPRIFQLQAKIGAATQTFAFDATGYTYSNMGWSLRTMDFTATNTTMALMFTSLDAGNAGPALDNVSILALCSGQTVVNGSFETGNTPPYGGTYVPAPNSTAISGWTVQSGSVDYIGNDTWSAAAGNRSLDLSGHNAGTIMQNVSGFTPGHQYRLSFYMAGNNDGVPRIFQLQAKIGAAAQTFAFDATGYTYSNMGWSLRTMDFTATNATMALTFTSLDSGAAGPALDNVCISELPSSGPTVLNGSFEIGTTPPFGGAYVPAPNSTTISNWTIQSGSVDYIGNDTWPAADGNRSLDLSGHNAGAIAQTISGFTPGHQYRLSFYMAGNNDGVPRVFQLQAKIGAVTQTFAFDATGHTYSNMGWSLRTMDFTATNTTMALAFTSLDAGNAGPALDNVSIAELCSAQTVVNGSFETGTTPPFGGTYIPAPNSTAISGWIIQSGSVDYIGNDTWPAADGNRSLDLSGHNAGTIMQNVSGFTSGHQYRLSFYMAGNNDGVPRTFHLQAKIGSITQTFAFDATGYTYSNMGWSLRTMDFTATNTTMALTFTSLDDGNAGPALDNVCISAAPASDCVAPPAGLVSSWRGEGNALDSTDGNNGTLAGNTTYGPGRVGQGLVFDGNRDLVPVGNPANLQLQNFTIEAWIKRASSSAVSFGSFGNGIIFGYGYGGYGLYLDPSGTPALSLIGLSATTPATTITDTNFHHLAVTKSGSTVVFYVDGTAYSAPAFDPGFTFSTVAAIGARGDNLDNSFLGMIDEVSVYNRALAANEVQAIYSAGSAGKCIATDPQPATVACWSANGHCYEFVRASLTWPEALAAAAGRSHQGLPGHLATITSTAENQFITANFGTGVSSEFAWMAGREPADDGVWRWAAGPESGTQFSFWASPTAPANFANWGGVEPNDNKAGEDYAMFNLGLPFGGINNGQWADAISTPNSSDPVVGYLVEYEVATPASNCVAPPSGLVSWWRGEGNFLDSGDGNNGTLAGNTGFAAVGVGQGFVFDGTGDGVLVGNPTNLQLQNFTIEAWIKRSSTTLVSSGPLLDAVFFSYGGGGYGFGLSSNGKPLLTKINVDGVNPSIAITDTNLHHLAVTKAGTSVVFYVDGTAYPAPPYNTSYEFVTPAAVGARGDTLGNSFRGSVDELAIYNRALSQAEIQAIYSANTAGKCVSPPPPTPCVPAPTGLVNWWRGEGDAVDQVGGINGTLVGGVSFVPGKVGQGFGLNGSNSYVQIPHSPSLNLSNELTVEFWYLNRGKPGWYSLLAKRSAATPAQLGIHVSPGGGALELYVYDRTAGWVTSDYSPAPASSVFHHLAATFRQTDASHIEMKTFVDGALVMTTTATGNLANSLTTDPILIGADYGTQDVVNGIIDEVSIYNRALSLSEVQTVYNTGGLGKCASPPPPACVPAPAGLVSSWRGEGNAVDSGDGNNGTLTGNTTYGVGRVGQGFVFDGNRDLVTLGNPTNLQLQNFTIEAWVRRASLSIVSSGAYGNGIVFGYGSGGYGLYLDANGRPALSKIGLAETKPSASITDTNFHHLAVTKSGSTVVFYVDGTAYSAPAFDPGFTFSTVAAIGARGDNLDNSFLGTIDDVGVYNRALAANEVQAIHNAGSAGKCVPPPLPTCIAPSSGLVSWWRGEGNALDFADANNGTLTGNTTYGAGRVGQGLVFDGNRDLVSVGNPANLQLQNFTIEAWIKRASASAVSFGSFGNGIIFGYGYGGYGLYLDPSGTPALSKIGLSATAPAKTITDTNLHHLAVTKSGSTVVFYVDGTAYSAPAFDPGFTFSTVAAIGARGDNLDNSFLGTIDDVSVYNRALAANEVQAIYNAGGAGKCVPPSPVNHPPVADAIATKPLLIVPAGCNLTVVLDGSRTSDPDADPLQYRWFKSGETDAFATGVVAVVTLPLGAHTLTLVVDDGLATDAQTFTVELITPAQAVDRLLGLVKSQARKPRPLVATLSAALASIERGNVTPAINQLEAFQNKVRAQVVPDDPALAGQFIQAAQDIIDAGSRDCASAKSHGKIGKVHRKGNGRMTMEFSASPGQVYLIEASTNLVGWEKIGVAIERGSGEFEFEDPNAARTPARFYRIVLP